MFECLPLCLPMDVSQQRTPEGSVHVCSQCTPAPMFVCMTVPHFHVCVCICVPPMYPLGVSVHSVFLCLAGYRRLICVYPHVHAHVRAAEGSA